MDPQEWLPVELWLLIIDHLPFADVIMLRSVGRKLNSCVLNWIQPVEEQLRLLPHTRLHLPRMNQVGGQVRISNLLWSLNDPTFSKAVSDQQPRKANRGLCLSDEGRWIWLRGPFESKSKSHFARHELYLNVFAEDNLLALCGYLKAYEVEMLANFVDQQLFPHKCVRKAEKSSCVIC